ncbi:MAG: alpha/beta hydrolase fold domain-containing protein [Verrucomicrobiae bacterium]|nr:alpha/beta hydrolase fold domain-containing protein [Verrucomicrobiae bacterium]
MPLGKRGKSARLITSVPFDGRVMKFAVLLPMLLLTFQLAHAVITDEQGGGFKPDKIIPYKTVPGEVSELNLHVFYPDGWGPGKKLPAIVFFFGGGWNGGAPAHFYIQAEYFASRGMVVICPDYRTRRSHGALPFQCVEDGRSSMRFVREHANELGIDPNRLAAGGGSAGGHVAAATGTIDHFDVGRNLDVNPVPNALVLFNPVYANGPGDYGYDRVKDYWTFFSPMHNIGPNHPPTIVFFGDSDNLVPVSTAEAYQKKMHELGLRSELQIFANSGHGFFNWERDKTPGKENFIATVSAADAFLASLGYLKGKPTINEWIQANR